MSDPDKPADEGATNLENLTCQHFEPLVESGFQVPIPGVELRLIEASTLGEAPEQGSRLQRQAFSLLFEGPAEPFLDQATHHLEHQKLGLLELFLVPVGNSEAGGFLYEAIFG